MSKKWYCKAHENDRGYPDKKWIIYEEGQNEYAPPIGAIYSKKIAKEIVEWHNSKLKDKK